MDTQIVHDQKTKFRFEQISVEGNDPADTGESVGTPSEMQSSSNDGEFDQESKSGSIFKVPEGGWDGAGRPKEVPKYTKDGSARGRDPLGRRGAGVPLALAHYDALKKALGPNGRQVLKETITDSDKISEEYEDFKEDK